MRLRPVLVGQAPGPTSNPDLPLYPLPRSSAGGRLQEFMGISTGDYLRTFDRVNLLREFPGKSGNGDAFPMSQARVAAGAVRPLLAGRRVLLLGRGVANAFGLADIPFLQERVVQVSHVSHMGPWTAIMAAVPHTSARNRWMNDPANVAALRAFLADWWLSCREL